MIEIRPAAVTDTPAIAALAQEVHAIHAAARPDLFQPSSATVVTATDVAHLAMDPNLVVLVAIVAGEIVGYAHAEVQRTPATSYKQAHAVLHLHAMGVTARSRGRGVGRAILSAVRAAARSRELGEVSLDVYAFNSTARAFYECEGFVPLKERLIAPALMDNP